MSFNPQNLELTNISNYKETIDYNITDVCKKYIDLVNYSIILGNENLSITDNLINKQQMFKGIEIISNIFLQVLMYTRNLDVTLHCCNQGIFYYIEYINQIQHKDKEFVFVNLTMQDAILYIYKKTIYDINDVYIKQFQTTKEDNKILKVIELFVKFYNNIINLFIYNAEFSKLEFDNIKKYLYEQNGIIFGLFDKQTVLIKYKKNEDFYNDIITEMSNKLEFIYDDISKNNTYKEMLKNIDDHINDVLLKYID
jgi:hypothetical protein